MEYLLSALNLVCNPGETFPPSYTPSFPMKSTDNVAPKSNRIHSLFLKRYLAAMIEAALSGVIYEGIPYLSMILPSKTISLEHSS